MFLLTESIFSITIIWTDYVSVPFFVNELPDK